MKHRRYSEAMASADDAGRLCVNPLRRVGIDAVEQARSCDSGVQPRFPSWEPFDAQPAGFGLEAPPLGDIPRPAVEAGMARGRLRYVGSGGAVRATLDRGHEQAVATLRQLATPGIDMEAVAGDLEAAGVSQFAHFFDQLMAGRRAKVDSMKVEGLA
jgi:hypothetical protein